MDHLTDIITSFDPASPIEIRPDTDIIYADNVFDMIDVIDEVLDIGPFPGMLLINRAALGQGLLALRLVLMARMFPPYFASSSFRAGRIWIFSPSLSRVMKRMPSR